jgi:RNA polymerase sigma-70 factor (ECF subfamily)
MSDDPAESTDSRSFGAVALKSHDSRDSRGSDDSDGVFVRAVLAGESWAERELFDRYSSMVHGTLRRCLGPVHELDDLTQDVFLIVFGRVKTLRDFGALRSFIYSIAIRVGRTYIRRGWFRRRSDSVDLEHLESHEAVTSDPEARDLLTRVQSILDRMKAKHRLAFVMRHLDGHSVCEVSEELDVSIATVNRWLNRAAQHIEREIGRDDRLVVFLRNEGASR